MTEILSSLSIYRPTYLFCPIALPIIPATGLQSDSPLSSHSHTVRTTIVTPSASQFRLLYLFKGTVWLQPSEDPSLSTQMMADHILHSQQRDMESPATIEGNVRDTPQKHTTANITCLVETHGEANSNTHPPSDWPDMLTPDEPSHGPAQQLTQEEVAHKYTTLKVQLD